MPEEPALPSAASAPRPGPLAGRHGRRWLRAALFALAAVWALTGWHYATRLLPVGVRTAAPWSELPASEVRFLRDVTTADAYGHPIVDQQIFDRALVLIGRAHRFVLLDYYLFGEEGSVPGASAPLRPLSHELEAALLARKRAVPGLQVLFITDPINELYGGRPSAALGHLRAAGVAVVVTDLERLPDPNPVYSGLWRLAFSWWAGVGSAHGNLPNPLEGGLSHLSFGAWGRLLNFKADHRKILIADDGADGLVGLVGSVNPYDPSSAHSNVALEIEGAPLLPLVASELAIARAAGWSGAAAPAAPAAPGTSGATTSGDERDFLAGRSVRVRVLTEGAILDALLERIDACTRGESIDVAMFYLSDREVIEALLAAAARGVAVRALLDPNKDAFGEEKSGLPNRQVASELVAASDGAIKVRWYRTHGEQFHTKLVAIYGRDRLWLTLGSANLTRRNLRDYNLEANLAVEASRAAPLADEVLGYFDTLWSNRAVPGIEYSASYDVYADPSQGRYWLYRIMEGTGFATF